MTKTRYGKYIQKLTFEEGGTGLYRQVTRLNGAPFGVDVQIEYGTYIAAGKMGEEPYGPHTHNFDQAKLR